MYVVKTTISILLLLFATCAAAVAPTKTAEKRKQEPFVVYELTAPAPESLAQRCNQQPQSVEVSTEARAVLYGLMLAARESGVEVQVIDEEICFEK